MGDHPRLADVLLAVSEVITNALRHTTAEEVEMVIGPSAHGGHRISLRYAGDPFAVVPRRDPTGPSGRGLLIVQSVTDRWGMMADGRVDVWFEV
jgi:anti-sigma regulatory factor (Ser/Thr protein kinase)